MVIKKHLNRIGLYKVVIIIFSILTVNYPQFIDFGLDSERVGIFFISLFLFGMLHQKYYLFFKFKNLEKNIKNLLYSSALGTVLITLIAVNAFVFKIPLSEEMTIIFLPIIYIVSFLVASFMEFFNNGLNYIDNFVRYFIFYLLNLILSYFVFFISMILIGGAFG